jgi:two-component system phosphate regulon sensor histidine kinase PhoR
LEQKTVRVLAEMRDRHVVISVCDNGAGIPAEEREKVFEKFHQIENSFTGQIPGAGLGLALCKKVVQEMGGEITLVSELGKGTTVSVSFPRA